MILQTEFNFMLPKGYLDAAGNLHRAGRMRLATAIDEIAPLRDPRVRENEAYLTIIMLSRVITRLGSLPQVDTSIIENLFSSDLVYLENLYRRLNDDDVSPELTTCPQCHAQIEPEGVQLGG